MPKGRLELMVSQFLFQYINHCIDEASSAVHIYNVIT